MKVRPLVVNEMSRSEVARVVNFAEHRRYNLHEVFQMLGGRLRPPGDIAGHICVLPVGYRCCFSIEQQPMGWSRHLSVSVLGSGQCPNEVAVIEISRLFGFRCPWPKGETGVELERLDMLYGAGTDKRAVNVVQLLEPMTKTGDAVESVPTR